MTRNRPAPADPLNPRKLAAIFANPQHFVRWAQDLPADTAMYFVPFLYYVEDRLHLGNHLGLRTRAQKRAHLDARSITYPVIAVDLVTRKLLLYHGPHSHQRVELEPPLPYWCLVFWRHLTELYNDDDADPDYGIRYSKADILAAVAVCERLGWPHPKEAGDAA